jgi:hypothetical protein
MGTRPDAEPSPAPGRTIPHRALRRQGKSFIVSRIALSASADYHMAPNCAARKRGACMMGSREATLFDLERATIPRLTPSSR